MQGQRETRSEIAKQMAGGRAGERGGKQTDGGQRGVG